VTESDGTGTVVLISAETEWHAVLPFFPAAVLRASPFGPSFVADVAVGDRAESVVFLHGGWGKIAAAASTQYAIDRWSPELLVNLGTCGGFAGHVAPGETILAERTVVYDIVERMGDPDEAIARYATDLDLSWLGGRYPASVRRGLLVSGDADLDPLGVAALRQRYGAVAGDWESGAIAYVAARNGVRCLILRGVSDLVGDDGGEAYDGNSHVFARGATAVMNGLVGQLPAWLAVRDGRSARR
jgi:adenosylhomocysteine nucleosidase